MAGNSVDFKANANGLVVVFDKNESFDSIYEQISKKLESGGFFFQTRYLAATYRGRKLSAEEENRISRMMAEKTGARTVLFEIDKDFDRQSRRSPGDYMTAADNAVEAGNVDAARGTRGDDDGSGDIGTRGLNTARGAGESTGAAKTRGGADDELKTGAGNAGAATVRRRYASTDLDECVTKYFRGTLRSGRIISYDGNIVVIGDVNPGAEVEATGNIIVLGNVRGIVHAGAGGNKDTSIIALNFAPTQLRIADIITRRSERRNTANAGYFPETAYIKGDAIIFEPLIMTK